MARSGDEVVGAGIRELRKARGLTQAALAEKAGLSFEAMSRIERGRASPRLSTLTGIAESLGVGLPELVAAAPHGSGVGHWLLLTEAELRLVQELRTRPAQQELVLRVVRALVTDG